MMLRNLCFSLKRLQIKQDTDGPDEPSAKEMTQIAEQGGAFTWLKDEPDIYSDEDGELV